MQEPFLGQKLLSLPLVSHVSLADEPLFRAALRNTSPHYSYSWLYILRACHLEEGRLGYKYRSEDLLATIGIRHGHIYIFPIYDSSGGAELQKLCQIVTQTTHYPILIKKIDKELFRLVTFSEPQNAPLEDDTFPETFIDLQKLFISSAHAVNPAARKMERRAQAFERQGLSLKVVTNLSDVSLLKLEKFLAHDPEKYASYIQIARYLYLQTTNTSYRVMVFLDKDEIRGLYMAEALSLSSLGLYGGITSKDAGGLTEWMDLYFFRSMYEEGIQTIYLGGAENSGISQYIHKLLPYKPPYKASTVLYQPEKNIQSGVSIREVHQQDFNALAFLYLQAYNNLSELGETWTRESAHKLISHFYKMQPDLFFLAEENNRIIGAIVASIQPWWDGNHLIEGEIFLDPLYLDTSINKKLVKHLLTQARKRYDAVSWDTITPTTHNHPLAAFKQIGFNEVPHWAAITGDIHTVLKRL